MKLPGLIDIHVHLLLSLAPPIRKIGTLARSQLWQEGSLRSWPCPTPSLQWWTPGAWPWRWMPPVRKRAATMPSSGVPARIMPGRLPDLAQRAAGLKMYLDQTYGPLRLDDMTLWMEHFARWPKALPIVAHAENRTLAAVILIAALYDRPLHVAHVSLREEILLIRLAKQKGLQVM